MGFPPLFNVCKRIENIFVHGRCLGCCSPCASPLWSVFVISIPDLLDAHGSMDSLSSQGGRDAAGEMVALF